MLTFDLKSAGSPFLFLKGVQKLDFVALFTNFFEMIAALAALAVSYLMYREVMKDRKRDEEDES